MARWLARLAVALLLALAVHGVVLWRVAQEMQALASVMAPHADPMFTRQITQSAVPAAQEPAISVPKQPTAQQNIARAAIKKIPKRARQEPALQATAPEPAPTSADSTPAEATLTATPMATPTSALASQGTAGQTITASALDSAPATISASTSASTSATTTTARPDSASAAAANRAAALALQGDWPADTRLSYQLGGYFRGDLHGNAQVQWTRPTETDASAPAAPVNGPSVAIAASAAGAALPSSRYQVRINISIGFTKAQLQSQGRVRANGLQPMAYEEQLPTGGRRSVTLVAREVLLTDGRRIPRPSDDLSVVQDTASQFVDLGHRFSTGRAVLKEGETLRVWLARPGGLDEWTYDVGPPETIYLPVLGAVQAHHLKPRPLATARGTITAEMWFAPSLQYLPVRIKITLNKDAHLDLLVQKIEQN
jgi:Protein of unknown function (DUF3108)